ncbi:ATP-dependent helicase [Ralstonia pseudosolanacearum]|uniref:Large helicase-related protein winged-helix domain-containing protein n=1 Tax=Ralstonia nicotianae (strain ATCC BAA-1114 / GMI1000) TaxID=267608 RepID=Q8XW76_RALN1|nr:ATP-dependent helicase [Ralstonia pseudosolanacearum]OAI72230.1 ATP-dependent helicase [Ralstonia solanacearum]CAD16306.1 hypothetical protein RSc2599 [Ralstonia pseudosolanacearum GMI1000]
MQDRPAGQACRALAAAASPVVSVPTLGDPTLAGRWSLLSPEPVNDTARALARVEGLLDRYGMVTRSAAMAEDIPGGFPALRPVFRGMEDAGRVLHGRFVEGLGAAQFAERVTVDRLRELAGTSPDEPVAVALSAADPANPFGTLLPWPSHPSGVRPVRRAGAFVVLVDGRLMFYLAQGGRHLLSYGDADAAAMARPLADGLTALAIALKRERQGAFTLERVDDQLTYKSPLAAALRAIGFSSAPKGLTWYG